MQKPAEKFDNSEIPVINKAPYKGDAHVYSEEDIQRLCGASCMKTESCEGRKNFRLHCVVRKRDGNKGIRI